MIETGLRLHRYHSEPLVIIFVVPVTCSSQRGLLRDVVHICRFNEATISEVWLLNRNLLMQEATKKSK